MSKKYPPTSTVPTVSHTILIKGKSTIDEKVETGIEQLKKDGILESGDIVVISGGAKILNNNTENQIIDGVLKI